MRPLRSLLIYLAVVFLGGALFAPWLYRLVQWLAPSSMLTAYPFRRFVERSLLAFALLGIWPLLGGLGVKPWRDGFFRATPGKWRRLTRGFILGFLSFACLAIIVLAVNARCLKDAPPGHFASALAGAVISSLVVPVLEEFLFRGAIFEALRRVWDWRTALLVSSLLYAIAHFLGKPGFTGPIKWYSGLELLPRMIMDFQNIRAEIIGFFNLTLAGAILCLAYRRTGDLSFSIGLHAGWVFSLKSYGSFTGETLNSHAWFWGTDKLIDGWLALLILLLTLLLIRGLNQASIKEAAQ